MLSIDDQQRFNRAARQMRWFLSGVTVVSLNPSEEISIFDVVSMGWMRMEEYYASPSYGRFWDLQRAMSAVFKDILEETCDLEEDDNEWLGVPTDFIASLSKVCIDLPVHSDRVCESVNLFLENWEDVWNKEYAPPNSVPG